MVHEAGELRDGVQHCERCGYVLTDYRNAMVPTDQGPLVGWAVGASVEVVEGNPRYSGITDDAPDCSSVT